MSLVAAFCVLAGLAALTACRAQAAGGGLKPSEAPLVTVGQHYFGNTNKEEPNFWRLPPLLTDDVVTVAWNDPLAQHVLCLTQDADDYNWAEKSCNGSGHFEVPGSSYSARLLITANSATAAAFLDFIGEHCCESHPYDFVVESIQHAVGIGLTPAARIKPTSTLTGSANLSNGSPVPDGMAFTLTATWVTPVNKASHSRSYTVTSGGGALAFPLGLPNSAQGKRVSLAVTRPADPQYLAASSPAIEATVAKLRRRHHRHHHHHPHRA